MNNFLKKFLLFISLPALIVGVFLVTDYHNLPAPKYTWSYSLNEKLFRFDNFDCDYLCVGSSTALNNVNSGEIVSGFSSDRYFNFASWGIKVTDIHSLLKVYLNDYKPRCVIFVSNILDFNPSFQLLKEDQVAQRIANPNKYIAVTDYFTHFDLPYYYKYYQLNRKYRSTDTTNASMMFDKYGGVPLRSPKIPGVNNTNWNDSLDFSQLLEENYYYLDTILKMLSTRGINFVFVMSPIREGLIDENYRVHIKEHKRKVRKILDNYNYQFIDATERLWPDTLFFDYAHLNQQGAGIFTKYFMDKINNRDNLGETNDMKLQNKNAKTIDSDADTSFQSQTSFNTNCFSK